ncbi:MAG: threonine/serine dehydratase [Gemmatimonadota bacterium]
MPALDDVYRAQQRVADAVRRTPLESSSFLSEAAGAAIHLKLECWQRTRSFKVRGAFNAVASLSPAERARGLVTASAGNHGQALALAALEQDTRATIFVPASAPQTKQARIRRLGADLRANAASYDEADAMARQHAAETGATYVHAFSDAAVIAGQATVALEILDELPGVREIVVPVGGGGLIAGIGVVMRALAPGARVIGVQSVETRAMYEAFRHGAAVQTAITPTLADGLAGCTDEATYRRVRAVTDEIVLVEERDIAGAIRMLHAEEGVTAEGSGAVAVAAVLSGRISLTGPAVLLVTGGNIDSATLAAVLAG